MSLNDMPEALTPPPTTEEESTPTVDPTYDHPSLRRRLVVAVAVTVSALLVSGLVVLMTVSDRQDGPQLVFPSHGGVEFGVTSDFAPYEPEALRLSPQIAAYDYSAAVAAIAADPDFGLSEAAQAKLATDGFVVVPRHYREFYPLYEQNRYRRVPNFVTSDAVLHNYHLAFDRLLQTLEENKLSGELQRLLPALLSETSAQQIAAVGTPWETAATRNLAYLAVATKLLDPEQPIPEAVTASVNDELALIDAAAGLALSPLMAASGIGEYIEDYSQYRPRGHYDKSDELRRYFRTMMWLGRITFLFKTEDTARSAVLLTLALDPVEAQQPWSRIYEATSQLVGRSDDIGQAELRPLIVKAYGQPATFMTLLAAPEKFAGLLAAMRKLKPPQVNSQVIFDETIQPDRDAETLGFRLMGQRLVPDAAIFQQLIYRSVKENDQNERRLLPSALDVPAVMGSSLAEELLISSGAAKFVGWSDNLAKLQASFDGFGLETWTQNAYWSWLHALRPLLVPKSAGYPSFMLGENWAYKQLETWLASWTELKHDTVLYAKQAYAELGGGPSDISERDDRGFVEPQPELYARLAASARQLLVGLDRRELLSPADRDNLELLVTMASRLKTISESELANEPLSEDDYAFIRTFGGQLEHFWLAVNEAEMNKTGLDPRNYLDQNPAALVTDVATDPNGRVLEEGTGPVWEIFAVVPVAGTVKVVKGGAYSHFEFAWPLNDRLTDAQWRAMVDRGELPARAAWTERYTVAP